MKIVKEYINEKFTEESDPIHDLGIGLKWAYIKPSDIIHNKTDVYMIYTHVKADEGDKYRLEFEKTQRDVRYTLTANDFYYIVMTVKKYKNGNIYIEAVPFGDPDDCKNAWDTSASRSYDYNFWKKHWTWWAKKANILIWNKHFEVV